MSNNDTINVAKFYMESIKLHSLLPRVIRADYGTENSLISAIHSTLRHEHVDCRAGQKSFIYGQSMSNQRIEAYWAQLRKKCPNSGSYISET